VRVWLCQIAKNKFYNHVKRNKFIVELQDEIPSGDTFELQLQDKTQAFKIHKILHL